MNKQTNKQGFQPISYLIIHTIPVWFFIFLSTYGVDSHWRVYPEMCPNVKQV